MEIKALIHLYLPNLSIGRSISQLGVQLRTVKHVVTSSCLEADLGRLLALAHPHGTPIGGRGTEPRLPPA